VFFCQQLNTDWTQVEVVSLVNDGSGLGFGIIGGKSTGVVVKTILSGGVAERVRSLLHTILLIEFVIVLMNLRDGVLGNTTLASRSRVQCLVWPETIFIQQP
jgi:hypothetical protein